MFLLFWVMGKIFFMYVRSSFFFTNNEWKYFHFVQKSENMQQYFPNLLRLILKCFHWASRQMIKFVICMFIWIFVSRKYILDYKTGISCANKSLKFNIRRKERACTNLPRKIKKKSRNIQLFPRCFCLYL